MPIDVSTVYEQNKMAAAVFRTCVGNTPSTKRLWMLGPRNNNHQLLRLLISAGSTGKQDKRWNARKECILVSNVNFSLSNHSPCNCIISVKYYCNDSEDCRLRRCSARWHGMVKAKRCTGWNSLRQRGICGSLYKALLTYSVFNIITSKHC
jgi:hypothetical protein